MGMSPFGGGFDFMFNIVPVIVVVGFVVILSLIIVTAIRGYIQWNRNNNTPVLTVNATKHEK